MILHLTPRAPQRLLLLISGLALLLGLAIPASAQQRPVPATLTQLTLVDESPTESHFLLIFEPRANSFAPVGTDPTHAGVGFALSTRRPSLTAPSNLRGLVRSISFDQAETILILRFNTNQRASATALVIDDHTIGVTVSTGAPQRSQALADEGPATGPVPQATDPLPGEDSFELVPLKYADVSEVVGLLTEGASIKSNDLFIPHEPAFGSNSLTGNNYVPGQTSQAPGSDDQPLGQSIDSSIAVDRRLNAIWLKGSPERIARLKRMIEAMDIPLDSVILETQFLELTESGAHAIGIDFANSNGQIAVATLQTGQYIPPGVPSGPRLGSVALQAAIYAQVSKGQGRIVSKPRISAQSGSTAKIVTGDALPILTSILSGLNAVSQQVQYVNVGVTLQIAPRVSADGFVSSHVFAVVSSVTGYSQGYPTISQREAETSATVRDGESFVIGGLTQEDVIKTKTKVPLLGDIPLIGTAFRTDRSTRAKTELYIIVTPRIVRRAGIHSPASGSPPPADAGSAPFSASR